ncbi:MAG: SDR family oxidoreductase, partial [Chloroflexota bacterium]
MTGRDLEGKLALVTGGAKGVGRVIVERLAERGAHVIVNYFHSLDAAKRTKAELAERGVAVDLIRASVAQEAQVDRMFQEIEARFGHLDLLINNAASGAFAAPDEVTEPYFARALDTNLKGSFWCARRAAPLMARRGGGCIVNVSSIGAGQVVGNYLVVGTSKAAVESLTRYLAVEYAPLNIRVNTASATMLEGEVARLFPRYDEMRRVTVDATPLGRLGTAEDLAGVVIFLTSDLSRWVTGQTILADGGLSLNSASLGPPRLSQPQPQEQPQLEAPPEPQPEPALALPAAAPPATGHGDGDSEDVAIVGMGLAVPGANDPEAYWRVLLDGPDLYRRVPADRWDAGAFSAPDRSQEDKTYQDRSVFITDFVPDPALRVTARATELPAEPTTLWLRHALAQALAGVRRQASDRLSFVVGYTADGNQHLEESLVLRGMQHRLVPETGTPTAERETLLADARAALEAHYWRGRSDPARCLPHAVGRQAMAGLLPDGAELLMVDTACSSSLYAVDVGIKGLLMGKHDVAVCGGSFSVAPRGSVLFAKLNGLSARGEARPLDKDADGVVFSDGAAVVVLKTVRRAQADGDRILAVLKACGTSSDGKGKAIYAPSSAGQRLAVHRAFDHSVADPRRIDWVVAHAT